MRSLSSAETTGLAASGRKAEVLMTVSARNRASGQTEVLALWTGEEARSFTIAGVSRQFEAAGALLDIPGIARVSGMVVRMQRVSLSPLPDTVRAMFSAYDSGLAPASIYVAEFDPISWALIAEPRLEWVGAIDTARERFPALSEDGAIEVEISSAARRMTRSLTLTRSDAVQSLRGGDRMMRFAEVSGKVPVHWGELGPAALQTSAAPATPPAQTKRRDD